MVDAPRAISMTDTIRGMMETEGAEELMKDAEMDEILHQHAEHQLQDNQCRTSKQFMQKVMYSVPLDKLYKVIASCQYNDNGEFCPVLCKIIDPTVLRNNNNMEYLLQVWSNRGDMVFEKPLR